MVMPDVSLFVRIVNHALDIKRYFRMLDFKLGFLPASLWQDCWPINSRSVCLLKPELYGIRFHFYCMFHPMS